MFLFLLPFIRLVGLDLGSQFLKLAISTGSGEAELFRDPLRPTFPSAAALKFPRPFPANFTARDIEDVDIRFGEKALPILKSNSSLGIEFIPRTFCRQNSRYVTSHFASPNDYFDLLLQTAVSSLPRYDGLVVVLPSFHLPVQAERINLVCSELQIPLMLVLSDIEAMFALYGAWKLPRFERRASHVLFIDVGAFSTKAYSGIFRYNNSVKTDDNVFVSQTAIVWTEKVGGVKLAQKLSERLAVGWRKAQKKLIKGEGDRNVECFEEELNELNRTISEAMRIARKRGRIDEVQLIGGASIFKFVADRVKAIVGIPVQRDFDVRGALAMGAVMHVLMAENSSPHARVRTSVQPALTLNLTCGERSVFVSHRSEPISGTIGFQNLSEICTTFRIEGNPIEYPEEADTAFGEFQTVSSFNLSGPPFNATFLLSRSDVAISHVRFCDADGVCEVSDVESVTGKSVEPPSEAFVREYWNSRNNTAVRKEIVYIFQKLDAYRAKIESGKLEPVYSLSDEMKSDLAKLAVRYAAAAFDDFTSSELYKTRERLNEIVRQLHFKLEVVPQAKVEAGSFDLGESSQEKVEDEVID